MKHSAANIQWKFIASLLLLAGFLFVVAVVLGVLDIPDGKLMGGFLLANAIPYIIWHRRWGSLAFEASEANRISFALLRRIGERTIQACYLAVGIVVGVFGFLLLALGRLG